MELEVDTENGVAYLYVLRGDVSRTVEVSDAIMVDIGKDGELIGIELIDFTTNLPEDDLVTKFGANQEAIDLLKRVIRAA